MIANEPALPAFQVEQAEGGELSAWALADKINHLFETVRRPDGSRYSNDDVAAAMGKIVGGPKISGAYLSLLRRGERDNPTKRHLEALAAFFEQSPAYFFDDAQSRTIAEELRLLRILADTGVQRIATRLGGLSPDSLHSLASIVEHIRKIEGLDAQEQGDQRDE
jgi:transcriptional regulator with XRE-family HTH domain